MKASVAMVIVSFLLLVIIALWFRADAIKAKAEAKNWKEAAADFERANEINRSNAEVWRKASINNALIAETLSSKVAEISKQSAAASAAVEKVYSNDPQSRAWADAIVPNGVRDAAQTRH